MNGDVRLCFATDGSPFFSPVLFTGLPCNDAEAPAWSLDNDEGEDGDWSALLELTDGDDDTSSMSSDDDRPVSAAPGASSMIPIDLEMSGYLPSLLEERAIHPQQCSEPARPPSAQPSPKPYVNPKRRMVTEAPDTRYDLAAKDNSGRGPQQRSSAWRPRLHKQSARPVSSAPGASTTSEIARPVSHAPGALIFSQEARPASYAPGADVHRSPNQAVQQPTRLRIVVSPGSDRHDADLLLPVGSTSSSHAFPKTRGVVERSMVEKSRARKPVSGHNDQRDGDVSARDTDLIRGLNQSDQGKQLGDPMSDKGMQLDDHMDGLDQFAPTLIHGFDFMARPNAKDPRKIETGPEFLGPAQNLGFTVCPVIELCTTGPPVLNQIELVEDVVGLNPASDLKDLNPYCNPTHPPQIVPLPPVQGTRRSKRRKLPSLRWSEVAGFLPQTPRPTKKKGKSSTNPVAPEGKKAKIDDPRAKLKCILDFLGTRDTGPGAPVSSTPFPAEE